ncbi:MAG: inorganic phosphate transporter [Clostridiales bacterium]|nr:inorganic phosphate transporter [Clostridiales bacterium]
MSFTEFINEALANPVLLITAVLTIGVILVNGWTDAPNAIATCVSTRCLRPRTAIAMAAVFNFAGVFVMTMLSKSVAETIYNMVDFHGDTHDAIIALCAAMAAIVLWAVLAWRYGIPTSESHALIAGLSGAAIALQGNFSGINASEWIKVIYGLVLSTVLGFALGWVFAKITELLFKNVKRSKANVFFTGAETFGAAFMAFMHGAQDGQKFIGVFLLGLALSNGQAEAGVQSIPIWLMVLCSLVMALGTSVGGMRIIKAVGMDMVKLEKYQGFSADLAGALCLLISSLGGLPVSTTHTKTTAMMGVGAAKRVSSVNWAVVKEMVYTWVLTFPGCGLIGFLMAKLFLAVL